MQQKPNAKAGNEEQIERGEAVKVKEGESDFKPAVETPTPSPPSVCNNLLIS